VVDRGEQPAAAEQIGQLASVDAIILVSGFQQGISARITHHHFRDVRLQQIVQPRRAGSFLKGYVQSSGQPVQKLQNRRGFRLDDRLHHQMAGAIQNHHRDRCLVNIQSNILGVIQHEGAPSVGVDANNQNLLQRGALL
jgi:hypothetical protein